MIWSTLLAAAITTVLAASTSSIDRRGDQHVLGNVEATDFKCDLPPALDPSKDGLLSAEALFSGDEALARQVERHSAIVKIPAISYDDSGEPGEDPRWTIFYELHAVLAASYPFVHARAARETVNTFGLVYTIKGTDASLKPLLLAAHQDVVPVADASTWKYPPFSAHFDGKWLWGRGASDDKNSLTALFSALEALMSNPLWKPKRTILIALGFDEESSGRRGAGTIGPYLEKVWGKNSIAVILDEGGMGLELIEGNTLYALPAVREKGHIDVWLDLKVLGGHSSIPFPHTGIGIMSEIVVKLESNPFEAKLVKGSPIYNHYVCQARYSPDAAPNITKLITKGDLDTLTKELISIDRQTQYRLQTSQAADYFIGGVKINAMPEKIRVGVNHRIAPQDSIPAVKKKVLDDIKPIAKKYGISVVAFEGEDSNPEIDLDGLKPAYDVDYNGTLVLSATQMTHVSPVSPASGKIWDVFSGTIQHTFAFADGKVVPVGELMNGNTDTRHYLNLSPNIYRWSPTRKGAGINIHTIDERIDMYAHMEAVQFYYNFVRNLDASDA